MKKFLIVFFIGQMLLFSYIFNQSIYDMYTLNNMGDSKLSSYVIENPTGNDLKLFYGYFQNHYLKNNSGKLQIIKTPIAKNNITSYEVYHTQIDTFHKQKSVATSKNFKYFILKESDFIDSTGVFYTDVSQEKIVKIGNELGFKIKIYNVDKIQYSQIIKYNLLNAVALIILTLLVLFIYTFMRIKINAIKKMLGFSATQMIYESFRDFVFIEGITVLLVLSMHLVYYAVSDKLVFTYYIGLFFCLLVITLFNIIILFVSQISIKFIDISSMIKNKMYSDKLGYILQAVKVILILVVTISISIFTQSYKNYSKSVNDMNKYKQFNDFYTSNGYNSDEYDKVIASSKDLMIISNNMKKLYEDFNNKKQLIVLDANILNFYSENYLRINNITRQDLLNSYKKNYIVLNEKYVNEFMNLKNENHSKIRLKTNIPCILVPQKYKPQEKEVKTYFINQYNNLLNYDANYKIIKKSKNLIYDIKIIYLENDLTYELVGTQYKQEDVKLINSIVLLDNGNFDGTYYLNLLSNGAISFQLNDRSTFGQKLNQYGLNKLLNASTLLTPFMDRINYYDFIMRQSLLFAMLFFVTLLFILYISNYINIMINRKRYGIEYIMGFNMLRILRSDLIITCMLSLLIIPAFILNVNIGAYTIIIVLDFIFLIYFYYYIIIKDVHKVLKGG